MLSQDRSLGRLLCIILLYILIFSVSDAINKRISRVINVSVVFLLARRIGYVQEKP